jgi:hypothetical protein
MTSKSPMRSAEDVDESTLSYAEIKALATGNPLIKEKMDLDVQVSKLKIMHSNYLSNKYSLEDKIIKFFPNEMKTLENNIIGFSNDIEIANKNIVTGEKAFQGMTVNNIKYNKLEKEDAGKALLNACRGIKTSEVKEIGKYRGFKMELSYDNFFNQFNLNLKGKMNHRIILGDDVYGNITRIDNILDNMSKKLEEIEEKLDAVKKQLESAKLEVTKSFPKEKELKEKTVRLLELDRLLNMTEQNLDEQIPEVTELDKAKDLIMEFIEKEYDGDANYDDLSKVDIAYTTTEDEKHEIQVSVDLKNYAINQYIDETLVNSDKYDSLAELIEYGLEHLYFDELVSIDDEDIEKVSTKNSINLLKTEERISVLKQLKKNNETVKYQEVRNNIKTRGI